MTIGYISYGLKDWCETNDPSGQSSAGYSANLQNDGRTSLVHSLFSRPILISCLVQPPLSLHSCPLRWPSLHWKRSVYPHAAAFEHSY